MHLKEQTYVVTLARAGTISKAAELLYISQPALSLYISNLEKTLGVKIFQRNGRRMVLTAAGELYVDKAQQMLELQEEFNRELAYILKKRPGGCASECRRSVRAAFPGPLFPGSGIPTRMWTSYGKRAFTTLWRKRSGRKSWICFSATAKRPSQTWNTVYSSRTKFSSSQNKNDPLCRHAVAAEGDPYPWIDLTLFAEKRFLLTTPAQSTRFAADTILASVGLTPSQILPIARINTIYSLVRLQRGVSFTSSRYLPPDYPDQDIMAFHVGNRRVFLEFCAIYLKGQALPEPAEALISWMQEEINKPHPYYR